jgi:hypothetical protein
MSKDQAGGSILTGAVLVSLLSNLAFFACNKSLYIK